MVLFGLDKKVKQIILASLEDSEIKEAVDKYAAQAVIRLLREIADAVEKEV
jgi:Mg/Co/Ni transporter MgtE